MSFRVNPNKMMTVLTGMLAVTALLILATTMPAGADSGQLLALTHTYSFGKSGLYVSQEDGTGLERISDDAHSWAPAAWSPDARRLAFVGNTAVKIWVVDRDGSHLSQLTDTYSRDPAWSPSGDVIAYATSDGEGGWHSEIWTMRPDGSQKTRLLGTPYRSSYNPAWSPDSRQIAFSTVGPADSASQIYVMNSDGSDVHRITTDVRISSSEPKWSPDGRQIALSQSQIESDPGAPFSSRWLSVINSDGSGMHALTQKRKYRFDGYPTWSARGDRIAFGSFADDYPGRVEIVDPSGSHRKTLMDIYGAPAYSPAINLASSGQTSAGGKVSAVEGVRASKGATVHPRSGAAAITDFSPAPGAPGTAAPEVSAREPSPSHAATTPSSDTDAGLGIVAISLLLLTGGSMMVWRYHRRLIRL